MPETAARLFQMVAARFVCDAEFLQIARISVDQIGRSFDDRVEVLQLVENFLCAGHVLC